MIAARDLNHTDDTIMVSRVLFSLAVVLVVNAIAAAQCLNGVCQSPPPQQVQQVSYTAPQYTPQPLTYTQPAVYSAVQPARTHRFPRLRALFGR